MTEKRKKRKIGDIFEDVWIVGAILVFFVAPLILGFAAMMGAFR